MVKKEINKKILATSLIIAIYIALIAIHGVSTVLTVGRLKWYKFCVVPKIISLELLCYDKQFACCAVCLNGKETEFSITGFSDGYLDTSDALLYGGNRHISLETPNSHHSEFRFPSVNFSTLKEGEGGNVSFVSIYQMYLNRLSY